MSQYSEQIAIARKVYREIGDIHGVDVWGALMEGIAESYVSSIDSDYRQLYNKSRRFIMSSRGQVSSLFDLIDSRLKRTHPDRVFSRQGVVAYVNSANEVDRIEISFIIRKNGYVPIKATMVISEGGCLWR